LEARLPRGLLSGNERLEVRTSNRITDQSAQANIDFWYMYKVTGACETYCMGLCRQMDGSIADGSMIADLSDVSVDLIYVNDILLAYLLSEGSEICFIPITINLRIIAGLQLHVGRDDTSQVHWQGFSSAFDPSHYNLLFVHFPFSLQPTTLYPPSK
jgi:hypothetical protein